MRGALDKRPSFTLAVSHMMKQLRAVSASSFLSETTGETPHLIYIKGHNESNRRAERDNTETETDVYLDMDHLLMLLLLLWSSGKTLL